MTVYLFTDLPLAGKRDHVYPGFAWTGGEVHVPTAGQRADMFPSCRAEWVAKIRAALRAAGHPDDFGSGWVTVHANPGHGTGEARGQFDGPETLLAALEDTFAAAGWTLIGTGRPVTVPGFFRDAAGAAGPGAAAEPEPTGPVAEPAAVADADGEVRELLRELASVITGTLG